MSAAVGAEPETLRAAASGNASEARLMWRRFRRHRVAYVCLWIVVALYLVAGFAEFFSPADPDATNARLVYHPPQVVHWLATTEHGTVFGPFVYPEVLKRDPVTLAPTYVEDRAHRIAIAFFVHGDTYETPFGFSGDLHLLGPTDPSRHVFLLGADRLGRDMLSRIIYGARISLSVGLVGVTCSLLLGIVFGGVSGYFGGRVDWLVQRLIEFIISLPTIPVWLALAAALPKTWSPIATYFMITLIISLVGWTQLARVIRGRFLTLRGETYVTAALLDGCSRPRIIFRHMLPALTSHIIASVTLAVPQMILAETALSFLGLGLQPPAISWGTLLEDAQNVNALAAAPWLLLPGVAVAIAVLSLNFLGDGLRDAADPHD
jgi:peptide/nickel transport system permease protein